MPRPAWLTDSARYCRSPGFSPPSSICGSQDTSCGLTRSIRGDRALCAARLRYAAAMRRPGQQDWRLLLAMYWITSFVEGFGVAQVYAFLPNRLAEVDRK